MLAPAAGPTRTAADCLAHLHGVVATAPQARRWQVVVDTLNTHQSESWVRWVADESDLDLDLGEQGKQGLVHTRPRRAALLSDAMHRMVFHDTPTQCAWLNQIEIWLSILVRKPGVPWAQRRSFTSVEALKAKVLRFSAYDTRTMATPFTWTYQGKPLVA